MISFLTNPILWQRVLATLIANGLLVIIAWFFKRAITDGIMKHIHEFKVKKEHHHPKEGQ